MGGMNKFEQYKDLIKEISYLETRISQTPDIEVTDYAYDYRSGKKRTILIGGLSENPKKIKLRDILEERKKYAENLICEMEMEINRVPDPKTRIVLSGYYCEGKTFQEVAEILGYTDKKTVMEIRDKYFKDYPTRADSNPLNPTV